MVAPRSTYRLQLGPDFGFADVAAVAGYLGRLGVTHVYLSPILQAAPGSTHGYDAVDQSRVSDELGGEAGLRAAAAALAQEGIGVVVDLVPNHVAIPVPEHLNPQVWSLLRDGRDSPFADWFDVHWSADERLLLPVLGEPLAACLAAGALTVDLQGGPTGEPVVRYFDHVFPVRAGTEQLPVADLVAAQHYELAVWRRGNDEINYRRFFDVDTLVGIRVERPEVFDATHATVLRLQREGVIEGFRIDHVDGLADPQGYLDVLAARALPGTWTVVEKILLVDEPLPSAWACAGTTGYDALVRVDALFVDPDGAAALVKGFQATTGDHRPWSEVERDSRRHVLGALLGAEVSRLVQLVLDLCTEDAQVAGAEPTQLGLVESLIEVLVEFPVYRLYVRPGEQPTTDVTQAWDDIISRALAHSPHRASELRLIRSLALGEHGRSPRKDEFVRRLQQTTGPAVAKGVEDTATYRWTPLSSLDEVGQQPDRTGIDAEAFHRWAATRADRWPATLNALTTHDTKRGEDVRARITALSEAPRKWLDLVDGWTAGLATAQPGGVDLGVIDLSEDPTTWLLWQTLWGAWPVTEARLTEYLRKAAREAKLRTSWLAPDDRYEAALMQTAGRALADPSVAAAVAALEHDLRPSIVANVLGARLVQLMLPGVADVYQGTEQVFLRLADPDNRHAPDWASSGAALDEALVRVPDPEHELDLAKLRLTSLALRLRRDHPEALGDEHSYTALVASGGAQSHFFGFLRGDVAVTVTRRAVGLRDDGGWADTVVSLTPGAWVDLLTETRFVVPATGLPLADLHARWPVALLRREP